MEMDTDNNCKVLLPDNVKSLQSILFPVISPRRSLSESFIGNFLLKSKHSEEDDGQTSLKSRESRDAFGKEYNCTTQLARWPTECQVLEERVVHICYTPSFPEPFYIPHGKEVQPKPVGEECGITVYQYYPISAVNYFSRSSIGGSKYLLQTCPSPEDDSLRFESRFESGNLAKVIKITSTFYELYLRTDLYTNRHMQWFYFRVTNMKKNVMYRFSIVNLMKEDSLYNEGMKPLMYSTKDSQLHSIGWRRFGENITYFCNENVTPDDPDQQMLYTLTFTTDFPHDNDTVYIAHSYPYTYTDLQDYLHEMANHPIKSVYTTLRLLCRTLAGNNVYYVTITSPPVQGDTKKKKAVVMTARVHPGETPSSWMMKGVLDFLSGDSGPAKELRDKFIFKLVPMLNPDGVIVGNTRCSLTGRDLNRQYRTVIRETYPSIWYTKLMIRRLLEDCGVAMYCDLHAHSRKNNIFIYGCENRRGLDKRLHEQVFPLMLHKNAADKFSFEGCKFRIQKCKEGTGRVVMWMMGISNSYTMEASFAGSILGNKADTHFVTQDYEQMGKSFCQTLLDFYDEDPRKEKLRMKILNRLVKEGSNADEPTNIQLSDYSSDEGDTSDSSDEVGREDYPVILICPPPSPALPKKEKAKLTKTKPKPANSNNNKSPTLGRKPLTLCKATLGMSLNKEKAKNSSETSSQSASEDESLKEKIKPVRKRKKKKKHIKRQPVVEYSDTELQVKKPERSVSVLDISPEGKLKSQSWHRSKGLPQAKALQDPKRNVTQQLAEVQAKLISLKNRVWLGTGGGDVEMPLSWGSPNSAPTTLKKASKKKSNGKGDKADKKKDKKKEEGANANATKAKATSKKPPGLGLPRQAAVEWITLDQKPHLQRTISLQEASRVRRKASFVFKVLDDHKKECKPGCSMPGCSKTKRKTKAKKLGKVAKSGTPIVHGSGTGSKKKKKKKLSTTPGLKLKTKSKAAGVKVKKSGVKVKKSGVKVKKAAKNHVAANLILKSPSKKTVVKKKKTQKAKRKVKTPKRILLP